MKYFLFLIVLNLTFIVKSQDTITFTSLGINNWVCPPNVTHIIVQCWGGGDRGQNGGIYCQSCRNGGNGGGYSESLLKVIPGKKYFLNVGKGGVNIQNPFGESSWFNKDSLIPTDYRGVLTVSYYNTLGFGQIVRKGGVGQNRSFSTMSGGGGGGAANPDNDGKNGVGSLGGKNFKNIGNGGDGAVFESSFSFPGNGKDGSFPGGGGGGGAFVDNPYNNTSQISYGGKGGDGMLKIIIPQNCTNSISPVIIDSNLNFSCGGIIDIKTKNNLFKNGLIHIWQHSYDGNVWNDFIETTDIKVSYDIKKNTNYFRIKTTCSFSKDSSFSNILLHKKYDDTLVKGNVTSNQNKCEEDYIDNLILTNFRGKIQWQSSYDSVNWGDLINKNKDTLKGKELSTIKKNTYYRVKLSSDHCGFINTDFIKIDVQAKYKSVEILKADYSNNPQYLCLGQKFSTLKLINNLNSTFDSNDKIQWQTSIDGINFQDKIGSNLIQFENKTSDTLKVTTYFRCIVNRSICKTDTSTIYKIKVDKTPTFPGELTSDQNLCYNARISTLKIKNHYGNKFIWYYGFIPSNTSYNFSTNKNKDSLDYNDLYVNSSLSTSSWFCKCYVSDTTNACGGSFTNVVSIQRETPLSVGTLTSTSNLQTICKGSQLYSDINLSAFSGDSIIWQKSTDNLNWKRINPYSGSTKLTQNQVGPIDTLTYFRVEIKRQGICPSKFSNSLIQDVLSPPISGEIISNIDTICYGNTSKTLKIKNFKSNLGLQWQYLNSNNLWTNVSGNQSDSLTGVQLGKIFNTTSIRVQVKGSSCTDVYTNIVQIPVSPFSVSGTLTSNQTICQGTTPSSVSIAGNVGNISWEKSTDGSSWNTILNASGNTLLGNKIGNLYTGTYLRGVIKNGACPSVTSNNVLISVDSTSFGGYPSVNQSLCIGSAPTNVSVSKYRGKINWQSSTDGYNFSDIPNAITSSLAPGAITSTTYYRTSAVNGVCPQNYSNSIQILVSPKSTVGTLTSSHIICAGLSPNTINLSSAVGAVSWQYSDDNLVWYPILNQTSLSLNNSAMGTLNSKRYYKAIVKSGICPSVTSNTISVSVNPKPLVSGGGEKSICQNSPITLTGSGASSYTWDNGIQNGVSFTPNKSILYTVIGTNAYGCKDTATVNVNLLPQPTIQIINPNSSMICQNSMFGLNTNSTDVSSYQWKLNGVDIPNAKGSSINYNKSGNYSVLGTSKDGCTQLSTELPISFTPLPTINAGIDRSICLGSSTQLLATQAGNYTWQNNIQNGDSVSPTATTNYIVSTTDNNGCSNSDTVTVFVNDKTYSELSLSSIDSYELNGEVYNQTGKYTQVLKNKIGCDSIITLNLVIEHLGLNNIENSTIKIFPNPTVDGKIYIETTEEIMQIQLFNPEGKTILKTNSKEINLGKYDRGVYFVEVNSNRGRRIFKVVY